MALEPLSNTRSSHAVPPATTLRVVFRCCTLSLWFRGQGSPPKLGTFAAAVLTLTWLLTGGPAPPPEGSAPEAHPSATSWPGWVSGAESDPHQSIVESATLSSRSA